MKLRYLSIFLSLAGPTPAFADDAAAPSDPATITVVATGSNLALEKTGQSITIIGSHEIASVQGPDLTRVLERAPGVTLTRNGGLGSFTGVRVRGAEAEQLVVVVDGVRIADVAAPGSGYDFGNLLTGGIGKIELLRGSNSVIWGSDAIGGVLAITGRELNGAEASVEYGAHNSVDSNLVAGVKRDRYSVTLDSGYTHTDGISAAASGTELDGFRQWHIGGRGRAKFSDSLALVATGRYADGKLDIDGYPPPLYVFADTPDYQTTREKSGRVGLEYNGGPLTLNGGVALSKTDRAYYDPTASTEPYYVTNGRSVRSDLTGHLTLPAHLAVDFGADSEWTRFSDSSDVSQKARLSSGHALLGWYGDRLSLAGGVRVDDHSRFGTHWTFGANGSYRLSGDWRLRGSFGEGFKAPSLYQLLSNYGNAALEPETSRSYDVGIEKGNRASQTHIAVTLFHRDTHNLIDFVSCFKMSSGICFNRPFGTYDNVGKARAEGLEVEGDVRPTERLSFHVAYSYMKAVSQTAGDPNDGNDLARRPRHALSLAGDWRTPLHDLMLGADGRLASNSFDDAANTTRLGGYFLVALRAILPVTDRLEIFGRVENVGDVRYQTAAGYGTYGRSAYVGTRARF